MKYVAAVIESSFPNHAVMSERVYKAIMFVTGAMSAVDKTVNEWIFRSQGRSALARLSPHVLKDIGLDSFRVQTEINKPFWRK